MFNLLYIIIIYPITQIIEFIFVFSENLLKNSGISIMCVSLSVSILSLPLYLIAERWQETERNIQKHLAVKIKKIKTAFKGDEQYMILATYYRQNHYHPFYSLRSTFGLLFQIPFFLAAYSYISQLDILKGTSFLFITDLGKPDALLPIAGGINFLPLFMTLINCLSGLIYSKGFSYKDKIQIFGISFLFLILLYNSSSGLVLYWTLNNLFSFAKNIYLKTSFQKKKLVLLFVISGCLFSFSFYTYFFHHGNKDIRLLISIISLFAGAFPWLIPFLINFTKNIKPISLTQKDIFFLFFSSLLILWSVSGLFLPSMLIASSPQEFSYIDDITSPLYFIFITFVQAFGVFVFWPSVIFFLLSKNARKTAAILFIVISFFALCNTFLFSGHYGPISSTLMFTDSAISHNFTEKALNFAVLLGILLIILSFFYIGKKKMLFVFSNIVLLIAVISFSVKNIYTINTDYSKLSEYYKPEKLSLKEISPIFKLSKEGNNIIIIMLDMAQSAFIPYIFKESPELFDKYEGFNYFPNTVTFNGWTSGGAPPLFGGYDYTPLALNSRKNISLKEKTNESLLVLPKLFSSLGYSVVITDPPYADDNWIPDLRIFLRESNVSAYITDGVYTDYWLHMNNLQLPSHSKVLERNLLWYSLFRIIPLAFRQGIYYKGSWCASFSENMIRLFLNGYSVLDNLNSLTSIEQTNDNNILIITNNTTHEFLFLQAPDYVPRLSVTDYGTSRFKREEYYHINAAAIKRISDYLEFLKLNNVYDNTRIILVSDHGRLNTTYVTKTNLPFNIDHFNPLLMVKDFNAKGKMETDMTFMTNADVPFMATEGIIKDPKNPFTGNTINPKIKNDPQLILIERTEKKSDYEIDINSKNSYYVHTDIFNPNNWEKVQN